jgi:DNA-binding Lrp family transcriptional regulator
MKSIVEIKSMKVGDYILKNYNLGFIAPFLNSPTPLAEVAEHLGIKLNVLHYHVNKMVSLGILKVVGKEIQDGRTVNVYQTPSKEFMVPFKYTSYTTLEDFFKDITNFDEFIRNVVKDFQNINDSWGVKIGSQNGKDIDIDIIPVEGQPNYEPLDVFSPNSPAFLGGAESLAISFEDAKELQMDLYRILKKYKNKSLLSSAEYLLIVGLTRVVK